MVSRVGLAALASTLACAHAEAQPPETVLKGASAPAPSFIQASAKCAPTEPRLGLNAPPWRGQLLLAYVVHEDGKVTDVSAEILEGQPPAKEPIAEVKDWIVNSCQFAPAKLDGVRRSVELGQLIRFGPVSRQVPMLRAGMTRPAVSSCATGHPVMPQEAREALEGGVVLVQYVVEADGRASDIELKAPGPVHFYRAVRNWLAGCRFEPATDAGRAVAVRIVQPFVFKVN
ncbi:MAG: energy transducer TonB [Myxococcales bacterium]